MCVYYLAYMKSSTTHSDLFSSFPQTTKEAWAKAAGAEIEGKNPFESLLWQQQGLTGMPYYDKSDSGAAGFILPSSHEEFLGARTWYNMPLIRVLEEESANKNALKQLASGADGILFDLEKKPEMSLKKLLKDIEWPFCKVSFIIHENAEDFFSQLQDYLQQKKNNLNTIGGFCQLKTYPHHPQSLHKVVHNLNSYPNFRLIGITSNVKDPAEQLSDLLAKAVTEVDLLTKAGVLEEQFLRKVFFSVHVGHDFFLEIAKLKVLRLLWYQIIKAYGVENYSPSDVYIHAINTVWSNETFQPHENMLANTVSGLASVSGGCTSLTFEPAADEERLERIALNVSHILREESHINKVADPTAGSYYLENLIKNLADATWKSFTGKISQA